VTTLPPQTPYPGPTPDPFQPVAAVTGAREPANFGPRFLAFIIDAVITSCVIQPLLSLLSIFGSLTFNAPSLTELLPSLSISLCVNAAYYGYFYTQKGTSPGKKLLKLEVISVSRNGERLTLVEAILRETLAKAVSWIIFGCGFLMAAVRQDKRALHDILVGSAVVKQLKA
jgi:uncharacterized RDD family membrane protein YckC